jgi:hypothetical protein
MNFCRKSSNPIRARRLSLEVKGAAVTVTAILAGKATVPTRERRPMQRLSRMCVHAAMTVCMTPFIGS